MKKTLITACAVLLVSGAAFASGNKESAKQAETPATLKAATITGPSGMGIAHLFANVPDVGAGTAVSIEAVGSADALLPKLITGELDIGVLPVNVAAKLYNVNPKSLVVGAVVGNGMLALVTRDGAVTGVAGLAGKTISVAGQGATPEYVLRTLVAKAGFSPESVTLDFSIPNTEIAAALVSDRIQYAFVPEPFATVAILNGSKGDNPVHRAFLAKDEWNAAGLGKDFPMTVCVIREDYAAKYPETVRKFLDAYRASIEWTVANPADAGLAVEAAGLGLKAPVATKAIPSSNFVFIPATDAKDSIERLLSAYLDIAPEAVGGKLPDAGFYFK
jgi:NitT/TauT family transport system substrate-binding protein